MPTKPPASPIDSQVNSGFQVADALGDINCDTWIAVLAERASKTIWRDSEYADPMLCILLRLPPALMHRFLSSWLSIESLDELLMRLPPVLHHPLIAAAAPSVPGHFTAPAESLHTFLSLLPYVHFPLPGLSAIKLPIRPTINCCTAAFLARAVSAHASLTSLLLDGGRPFPPAAVGAFRCCLTPGALPALTAFSISTSVHPNGCAELALCLGRLTSLQQLTVCLVHDAPRSADLNPSLNAYVRAVASPAQLPRLSCLKLKERVTADDRTAQTHCDMLLPLIAASRLTALEITSNAHAFSFSTLLSTLSHFTALQKLDTDANLVSSRGRHHVYIMTMLGEYLKSPPRRHDMLPALSMLTSLGLRFHGISRTQIVEVLPQLPALAELQVPGDVLGQSDEDNAELDDAFAGLTVTAVQG